MWRGAVGGVGELFAVGRQVAGDKGVTTVERPGTGRSIVHGERIEATQTVQVQQQNESSSEQLADERQGVRAAYLAVSIDSRTAWPGHTSVEGTGSMVGACH